MIFEFFAIWIIIILALLWTFINFRNFVPLGIAGVLLLILSYSIFLSGVSFPSGSTIATTIVDINHSTQVTTLDYNQTYTLNNDKLMLVISFMGFGGGFFAIFYAIIMAYASVTGGKR